MTSSREPSLFAAWGGENFTSLTDEQIQTYTERFAMPELFLSLNGHIIAVPVKCID